MSGIRVRDAQGRADTVPLEERFWSKVDKTGDCWLWTGATSQGYGFLRSYSRQAAHRVSYELANGPIPAGMVVCHRCDNPTCVRPEHLFLGTQADNIADMRAKGRASGGSLTGESNPAARLTEDLVRDVRRRHAAGGVTQRSLAREVGVSTTTISDILHRRVWKSVA